MDTIGSPQHVRYRVLVCDDDEARVEAAALLVAQCGAEPDVVRNTAGLADLDSIGGRSLALVGLAPLASPTSSSLALVRALRSRGLTVIAYAAGAASWPLASRCQALLAGVSWLLDSADGRFVEDLGAHVANVLRAEAGRAEDMARLRAALQRLGIVAESPEMLAACRWALLVGPLSDLPTLITGETGTGKQLLAEAVYQLDPKRRDGPFVAVNCSAISPGLAESELFGHRRGAFTGADRDRKGLFRAAHGGVLFLDEIGELDDALQAKLLRVLQEGRVLAVGDDQEVSVSVRIIAATNCDLAGLVERRRFRADLLHRLDVLTMHIQPLRQRPADIGPLVQHFIAKHRALNPRVTAAVAPEFIQALMAAGLPGNARQLENIVRRAIVQKEDNAPFCLRDLPADIWQQLSARTDAPAAVHSSDAQFPMDVLKANDWSLAKSLGYCERSLLETALQITRGNHARTARLLGITPRSVYNKVRRYHLAS